MAHFRVCLPGILAFAALAFCLEAAALEAGRAPEDAASIRAELERTVAMLESPEYLKSVSTGEYVVLAFQLAQHREPTAEEFLVLSELYGGPGFTRGEILAMAISGRGTEPTWEQCRQFACAAKSLQFGRSEKTRNTAARLAETCLSRIEVMQSPVASVLPHKSAPTASPPNEAYNVYFGYLHAHCELSDGTGTAEDAYCYARDEGHLDYFALTDHAELLAIWPWENKWQQLRDAAEAANAPGEFVTLWGFEWSNPVLGHINVLNSQGITSALENFGLDGFYRWLSVHPEAFGLFNHPGYYDALGLELARLRRVDGVVDRMVGIEVANENESLDRYYYNGSWDTEFSYWDEGNLKGWRLGPVIGQDNHHPDWGTHNTFRTAVLARELTREAIIDAYENRRFYMTENPDLRLDFRCCGYPMGAELKGMERRFSVNASSSGGDSLQQIRLFRDGVPLQTLAVLGNSVEAEFSDTSYDGDAYYYVIVTGTVDTDGNGRNDEAVSSPIWLEGPDSLLPSARGPMCGTLSEDRMGVQSWRSGDRAAVLFMILLIAAFGRVVQRRRPGNAQG